MAAIPISTLLLLLLLLFAIPTARSASPPPPPPSSAAATAPSTRTSASRRSPRSPASQPSPSRASSPARSTAPSPASTLQGHGPQAPPRLPRPRPSPAPRARRLPRPPRPHRRRARPGRRGPRPRQRQLRRRQRRRPQDRPERCHDQPVHVPRRLRLRQRQHEPEAALRERAVQHIAPRQQLAGHGQEAPSKEKEQKPQRSVGGIRKDSEGVPQVDLRRGPRAAGGERHGGRGPRGGEGRERELHDGHGGGGGGAEQQRDAVRDLREAGGLLRERRGGQQQDQPHVHRRRDREDGDQGQPECRRRVDYLSLCHCSHRRQRVPRTGHHDRERRGPQQAPGGGAAQQLRPLRVLPLQLRGLPGHALRPLPAPVLPRLRRLRHRRLRVRQRGGRAPEVQPLRPEARRRPEEHLHRAGEGGPEPDHGDIDAAVQDSGRGGPPPGGVGVQVVPREAVEEVLEDGGHAVEDRGPDRPGGWLEWDGDFALDTLYYGEYMNRVPARTRRTE
ncbi:putative pectinesterase [Iris pallida]|uniref:Pectinesterase n=1 Tax=Iris pallida TaxID=29817 RepID=A0AAX6IHN6_IRIPA|nr:putative pectinesterase [Iris pallida]